MTDFPGYYLNSFYRMLMDPENDIEVLTYADLTFGGDDEYEQNYPKEREIWLQSLSDGSRDPSKKYVFIQHDVDHAPERTNEMLEFQSSLGLRSNVMIFNKPVNRSLLQKSDVLQLEDYEIDIPLYLELQKKGWVFGYHSNAYERAHFDQQDAQRIFIEDVKELRSTGLAIEFYCPHGGVRDSNGNTNNSINTPESLRSSLKWTLNKHTIKFDGSFSDGGFKSRDDWDYLDLRRFVEKWEPGKRYRILFHPQYYGGDDFSPFEPMLKSEWYAEICSMKKEEFHNWWNSPPPEEEPPDDFMSQMDFQSLSVKSIRKILDSLDMSKSGTKSELIQRLAEKSDSKFTPIRRDENTEISVIPDGSLEINSVDSKGLTHTVLSCVPDFLSRPCLENFSQSEEANLIFDIRWRVSENMGRPTHLRLIIEAIGENGKLFTKKRKLVPSRIGRQINSRLQIRVSLVDELSHLKVKIYQSREQRSKVVIEKISLLAPPLEFSF